MNIGRNELLVGVAILVVAVLIVVPIFVSDKTSHLDEVVQNVDAIRAAELQYESAFGTYVSADAAPRAVHEVNDAPVPWAPTEGFRKLSWAPATDTVLGAYFVQADKSGFKVVGTCDMDGDGRRAVIEATADGPAKVVSAAGVY